MKKNHDLRCRSDKELINLIQKSINKIKEEFGFELRQSDFMRSAIKSYCMDIISNRIKLQIEK